MCTNVNYPFVLYSVVKLKERFLHLVMQWNVVKCNIKFTDIHKATQLTAPQKGAKYPTLHLLFQYLSHFCAVLCRLKHCGSLEIVFNASSCASDIQWLFIVCFNGYSNSVTYSTITHYWHLVNVQTFIWHVWDILRLHLDCASIAIVFNRWQFDFLWSGQQTEISSMLWLRVAQVYSEREVCGVCGWRSGTGMGSAFSS